MYCKKCGVLNEDDALFCKKCGTSLVLEYEDDDYQNLEKNKSKNKKAKELGVEIIDEQGFMKLVAQN